MGICEDTSIFKESILISCRMMSELLLRNISQYPSQILSPTSQPAGFSRLLQISTNSGKDKKKKKREREHAFTFILTKMILLLVKILHTLTLPYSSLFFPVFQSFIFNFIQSIWGIYLFSTPYQYSSVSHLLTSICHEIHSCIQHWFIILQIPWRLIIE